MKQYKASRVSQVVHIRGSNHHSPESCGLQRSEDNTNTKSVSLLRFGKEERSILLPTRALGGNKSVPFAETIKSNYSRLETSAEKQYSPQTLGLTVQKEQKGLEK